MTAELAVTIPPVEPEHTWSLGGGSESISIIYHEAEGRWQISFKCREGKIIASAFSPLEFTTILHAIGTKRLWPRTETVDEALFRGLNITKLPTMFAYGGDHRQNSSRRGLPPVVLANRAAVGKAHPPLSRAQLAALTVEDLFNE